MTRVFILITGAYVGEWAWTATIRALEVAGYRAFAVSLPGLTQGDGSLHRGLDAAIDRVSADVESLQLDDFVLVTHNIAGLIAGRVARRFPDQASALVYWSSYVPVAGTPALDDIPEDDRSTLQRGADALGGHSTIVPLDRWRDRYVQTLPRETRDFTYSFLSRQPWFYRVAIQDERQVRIPAIPTAYIVGDEDRALPSGWWATQFASRLGVAARTFHGTHMAMLTEPRHLAEAVASCFDTAESGLSPPDTACRSRRDPAPHVRQSRTARHLCEPVERP